jgi:hypothetical protein
MRAGLVASFVVSVLVAPRLAAADDKADCNFIEISATTGKDAAVDPDLKPLEKKLKKPPFSAWNVFHTLSSGAMPLVHLHAQSLPLKQGAATILLRDRADKRLELTISVDGAEGKRLLDTKQAVNAGEWNLWGYNVNDDGHILALTCR